MTSSLKVKNNVSAYGNMLTDLKEKIRTAQVKAALSVNSHLVMLYWEIGNKILQEQQKQGWGAKVIERIALDLKIEFPQMKGLSVRNLKYMRKFAGVYQDFAIVQQVAAQLPWFHNIILIEKVRDENTRLWYIHKTIENGWSRNVLELQIGSKLYERQSDKKSGKISNFADLLPKSQSDLAENMLKDPYIFDFLNLGEEASEREIEKQLTEQIRKFLLELGAGFAFVGTQYHLEVGGEDFYIDMLFYHLKLRSYIVIELKTTKFKPEYAGKLNFYLAVVDDIVKSNEDNPTIGLLLCRDKNKLVAEYSLRDLKRPIGVSAYKTEKIKETLPSIEKIEEELNKLQSSTII